MIIGFAGRKESGKTELANLLTKMGYKKVSFATELKKLISKAFNIPFDELNSLKNVVRDYEITDDVCDIIASETGISIDIVKDFFKDKKIRTIREALQVIGTDLIRKNDNNWHVRKTIESLEDGKDYVFDDVRFPNEMHAIENLGGDCWFIIRNKFDNVSNHESETSLNWHEFGYNVIVNDGPLDLLLFNCGTFFSDYENNIVRRDDILFNATDFSDIEKIDDPFNMFSCILLNKALFECENEYEDNPDILYALYNKDKGTIDVHYNTKEVITKKVDEDNIFDLEDLKKYFK